VFGHHDQQVLAAIRVVETGLATVAGAALGGAVGLLGGAPLAIATGVSAGINGAFGGYRQSTTGAAPRGGSPLPRTPPGPGRDHAGQRPQPGQPRRAQGGVPRGLQPPAEPPCVRERARPCRRGFALAHGNVISNASTGRESLAEERRPFIDRHEGLHVWQSRIFGPIYQVVYVVWFAGAGPWSGPPPGRSSARSEDEEAVETAAYYDNPFEFWAYKARRPLGEQQRRAHPQVAPSQVAEEEGRGGRSRVARGVGRSGIRREG